MIASLLSRQPRLRTAAQAALLVSAAALAILLSPPPYPYQRLLICARMEFIGRRAHIVENCDAGAFVKLARDPSSALDSGSFRQTRPGYGVLGWTFALPFRMLDKVAGSVTAGASGIDRAKRAFPSPYYSGYVALNWVLMVVAAMLLADLIGAKSLLAPAALVPTSVLLVNHVTKAFFWTPHLQIVGLFACVLSIWLARRLFPGKDRIGTGAVALLGLCAGIACLIYGIFVLISATLTVALFIFCRREGWRRSTLLTCILWMGTLVPFGAWRMYVTARNGSFYSHETQTYHQFVWIAERLREGPSSFLAALAANLETFLGTFPQGLLLPVSFGGAAFLLAVAKQKSIPRTAFSDPAVKAATAFLLAAVPFFSLMGFYDPRLTATLAIPVLVIVGSVTRGAFSHNQSAGRGLVPEPVTLAAIGYVAIVILMHGPYA